MHLWRAIHLLDAEGSGHFIIANKKNRCEDCSLILPSYSVFRQFEKQFVAIPEGECVSFFPFYGSPKAEEVLKLREENKHPLAIYHPAVSNNLMWADNRFVGTFGGLWHDMIHVRILNLRRWNERQLYHALYHRVSDHLYQWALSKGNDLSLESDFVSCFESFCKESVDWTLIYKWPEELKEEKLIDQAYYGDDIPKKPTLEDNICLMVSDCFSESSSLAEKLKANYGLYILLKENFQWKRLFGIDIRDILTRRLSGFSRGKPRVKYWLDHIAEQ